MKEKLKKELHRIHGELVEVETCLQQLGAVTREIATPKQDIDTESMMYFIAFNLGMYTDKLSAAEEALDNILYTKSDVELA